MAEFKTIHTNSGLIAMAQAEATGTPINLTHMAVGDGNGNEVTPDEGQSTLVREMYRASVNRVFQDPSQPKRFTAELVIPGSVGGFVLREVGVFDQAGSLFAVGNLPPTYKPDSGEGAYADTVVRLEFMVANADVVTLQIDPAVAVATQIWVTNNITAAKLIPGGTTGQGLFKESNVDGDYVWKDPTDANVVVDTIEEDQTLAAGQTIVTLAITTTYGLAVYINGDRLRRDQWTADPLDETKLTLAASYPDGTKFVAVQNEPAGSSPAPLVKSLNLSDVQNKPVARQNLGVYSKAEVDQRSPVGVVDHYAAQTPPPGWLVRDGSAISRTAYSDLFAVIGVTFGPGDGFNTFNLPDDRGIFDGGWGGLSSGIAFGSYRPDQLKSHSHRYPVTQNHSQLTDFIPVPGTIYVSPADPGTTADNGFAFYPTSAANTGGTETFPRHRLYLPIIKY